MNRITRTHCCYRVTGASFPWTIWRLAARRLVDSVARTVRVTIGSRSPGASSAAYAPNKLHISILSLLSEPNLWIESTFSLFSFFSNLKTAHCDECGKLPDPHTTNQSVFIQSASFGAHCSLLILIWYPRFLKCLYCTFLVFTRLIACRYILYISTYSIRMFHCISLLHCVVAAYLLDEAQPRVAQALRVLSGLDEQSFVALHFARLDTQYEQQKVCDDRRNLHMQLCSILIFNKLFTRPTHSIDPLSYAQQKYRMFGVSIATCIISKLYFWREKIVPFYCHFLVIP